MQVRERRANTTASRLNGRTVMCVVALTLAEARPLREQMEQRRGKFFADGSGVFA